MENVVRMFLEKDMLVSPDIFNQVKDKQQELPNILNSISYSLVVNSLDVKSNDVKQEEIKKPSTNTVFQRFVQETKPEIKMEAKKENFVLENKIDNSSLQLQVKTETPIIQTETKLSYNHDIKILRSFQSTGSKYSIDDFIKSSNERYEFLRKILSEKIELQNLTSINKVSQFSEFSIIGIVKSIDKKERTILEIEDSTGSIKVLLESDNHRFLVGDVIGLNGIMKKEFFVPKKIIFPDIPIKRSIITSANETSILFCGKIAHSVFDKVVQVALDNKANYIFTTGKKEDVEKILQKVPANIKILYSPIYLFTDGTEPYIGPKFNSDKTISISSPSLASIEGVSVLVYNGSSYENLPRSDEGILEIIKRRYIPLKLSAENFLIDNVPDVVYSSLDKASFRNYKGSTLISCDDSNAVLLNLKTRESKVVSLV